MPRSVFDDYSRIRVLWPDHLGLARGKYVPGNLAHKGTGFCATTFGLTYEREIIDAPHAYMMQGLRDVHGTPVAESLRPSWGDDKTGVAVGDLRIDDEPYVASSRSALEQAVAAWGELGYAARVGIELEGYLLEPAEDGTWQCYSNPRSMVYGTGILGDPSGFVDQVMFTADRCGFILESVNVEFDESQFEFTLQYDDAVRAIDDAFMFRVLVRETAIAMGLDFTFLGKPFIGVAGSGTHINFSLADTDGAPALADTADAQGITSLTRGCLAGLVKHHRALTAVTAPTVNAYRRLQPGELAGCFANWGIDHRNVANRIPSEGGPAMRIESRVGDGAIGLHLGTAAVLQAARLGVVNQLEAPPAVDDDGFEGAGADRSATSLGAALDDLEADVELMQAIGQSVIDNFVFVKRHEVTSFDATGDSIESETLTDFERAMYLPYH